MIVQKANRSFSLSSLKSEIISLGAGLRIDILEALQFWEFALETLQSESVKEILERHQRERVVPLNQILILVSLSQLIMCRSTIRRPYESNDVRSFSRKSFFLHRFHWTPDDDPKDDGRRMYW